MSAAAVDSVVDVSSILQGGKTSAYRLFILIVCMVIMALDGIDAQSIAFVAPVVAPQWHLTPYNTSWFFVIGNLGAAVGAVVLGIASLRFGQRSVVVAATICMGLSTVAAATASGFQSMLFYRALTGIFMGPIFPVLTAMVVEYAPKGKQASWVGLLFAGYPVGNSVGGSIAHAVIPNQGWQALFIINGVIPVVVGIVAAFMLPESLSFLVKSGAKSEIIARYIRKFDDSVECDAQTRFTVESTERKSTRVKDLFTGSTALTTTLLWLVCWLAMVEITLYIYWMPSVLKASGMDMKGAIGITVGLLMGGLVGSAAVGFVMDFVGRYRGLVAFNVLAVIALLALGHASEKQVGLGAVAALVGFLILGSQVGTNGLTPMLYPAEKRVNGLSWASSITRVGAISGQFLGGILLGQGMSAPQIFYSSSILAALAAIVLVIMSRLRANATETNF
ncbi:MFS transporter [Paraburkholderia tropica]|uniref:MFS transporter n=1 Tax=Paraburkholderia tropica TaxID=92647 RepID=UPI002AB7DB08|nr:MFS transporter [Paraburkholderia tropica]